MRRLSIALLLAAAVFGAPASGRAPRQEIDNTASFARLYGVVRYFYPSDAAAALDWNHFAVHGVRQARAAGDVKALETALRALVRPARTGHGDRAESCRRLRLPATLTTGSSRGATWVRAWTASSALKSIQEQTHESARPNRRDIDGFVSLMQTVPAPTAGQDGPAARPGSRDGRDATGAAALWLTGRSAGPGRWAFSTTWVIGPIREPEWREYTIEGTVADDARRGLRRDGLRRRLSRTSIRSSSSVRAARWRAGHRRDQGSRLRGGGRTPAPAEWNRVRHFVRPTPRLPGPPGKAPEGRQYLRFSASVTAPAFRARSCSRARTANRRAR